jgi:hypothetical protein
MKRVHKSWMDANPIPPQVLQYGLDGLPIGQHP